MLTRYKFPWLYILLAYGLAWLFWIPVALTRQDYQSSPLLLMIVFLGIFGPGIAGILLTHLKGNQEQRRDFWRRMFDMRRIRPSWFLVLLFLWPAMQYLALGLSRFLGGVIPESELLNQMNAQPLSILVVVVLYLLQAGLEELGWRGYMLERLLPEWGALKSSLLIGVFHAFWHLPMFWVVGTNQIKMGLDVDFLIFVTQVFAFSIYSTWVYTENAHSTLAVTLFHGVGNLCLDIFVVVPGTIKSNIYTLLMVAGAMVLSLMWLKQTSEQKPYISKEGI